MARQIGQHPLRPKAKETLTADGGLGTGKLSATADPGTKALESECRLKLPVSVRVVEVCRKYWCTSRALALKIPRYANKPPHPKTAVNRRRFLLLPFLLLPPGPPMPLVDTGDWRASFGAHRVGLKCRW